jgi:hypothetical protein
MKYRILSLLLFTAFFYACRNGHNPIVDTRFTDSLIGGNTPAAIETTLSADIAFWEQRIRENPGSFTALGRYSGDLVQRFHLYGDINDLVKADSIEQVLEKLTLGKDAGIMRARAALDITRHRFKEADNYVQKALAIGSEQYASTLMYFDTRFELGSYILAQQALNSCKASNEYGYFFRLSKWKHLQGEADSAVFYMQKAAEWAGNNAVLLQTARSNIADLYLHEGKPEKAAPLYRKNLEANSADYHSLQGLGRIALLHDKNPKTAEKIFRFIAGKNQLPDPYYNLEWVAEAAGDSIARQKAAALFVSKTENELYGSMYHKYQIEMFTGILDQPAKAVAIATAEIANRATPQTYTWLVWSLHKAGNDAEAWKIYKTHVSGKPLETLELFWMGQMMKDMGKDYNANAFFKAADKNRYDLSPVKQRELKDRL